MLGLVLLYVGAVLVINGLAMLGRIAPREAAILNIFTGVVSFSASFYAIFFQGGEEIAIGAFGLLFAFTYLWVAYNNLTGQDGRGLGWFSLFVAITVLPLFWQVWQGAETFGAQWLALNWAAWSVLWFSFFVIGVCGKPHLTGKVALLAIAQGVVTAWVPGLLILLQRFPV